MASALATEEPKPRNRVSQPIIVDEPQRSFPVMPVVAVCTILLLVGVVAYQFTGTTPSEKTLASGKTSSPSAEKQLREENPLSFEDPYAHDAEHWGVKEPNFSYFFQDERERWQSRVGTGFRVTKLYGDDRKPAPMQTYGQFQQPAPMMPKMKACPGKVEDIDVKDYKFFRVDDEVQMVVMFEADVHEGRADQEDQACAPMEYIGTSVVQSTYTWKPVEGRWVWRQGDAETQKKDHENDEAKKRAQEEATRQDRELRQKNREARQRAAKLYE